MGKFAAHSRNEKSQCTVLSGKTLAFLSAPGRARTYNLRFRRPTLYPIELRVRSCTVVGALRPADGSGQVSSGAEFIEIVVAGNRHILSS